jgi:hypothetical protein
MERRSWTSNQLSSRWNELKPMGKYTVSITQASDRTNVVRLVREVSALGVAEITHRIGTLEPIAEFDTSNYPIELDRTKGMAGQQQRMLEFLAGLQHCGAVIVIRHHAGSITETASPEILSNLFESERQNLEQDHD